MDFAERTSLWVGPLEAIRLQAAHQPVPARDAGAEPATARAAPIRSLAEDVQRVHGVLARAIAQDPLALANLKPTDPEFGYAPFRQRHLELQRQMEPMTGALRDHLRQAVGRLSPRLRQLAELDAALEHVLAAHEQKLLPASAALLERRFNQLRRTHREEQEAAGSPTTPRSGSGPADGCTPMARSGARPCSPNWTCAWSPPPGCWTRSATNTPITHEQSNLRPGLLPRPARPGLGRERLRRHQRAGAGHDRRDRGRLPVRRQRAAPVPRHDRHAAGRAGRLVGAARRAGRLAGARAGGAAPRGAPARRRRARRPARPGAHALPGRPAGDAGHAGHLPGHGGHLQGRGVRAAGLHRPAGDPRGAGRADQGPGPVVRHLGGRRGRVGPAGADVGDRAARAAGGRAPAGRQGIAGALLPFSLAHQRQETLRARAVAGARPARGGRVAAGADGAHRAPQPSSSTSSCWSGRRSSSAK